MKKYTEFILPLILAINILWYGIMSIGLFDPLNGMTLGDTKIIFAIYLIGIIIYVRLPREK